MIDPTERERQVDDKDTRHPRWRSTIIIISAGLGMLLWLVIGQWIPK
jgi:hypothetical protein